MRHFYHLYLSVYKEITTQSNSFEAKDTVERLRLCRTHLRHMEILDLASTDNTGKGQTEYLRPRNLYLCSLCFTENKGIRGLPPEC